MNKQSIAAKLNASDALMKGKIMNKPQSQRETWQLWEETPDRNTIEDSNGRVYGHLLAGTNGRWQLISADCMSFANFDTKPNLQTCLSVLRLK